MDLNQIASVRERRREATDLMGRGAPHTSLDLSRVRVASPSRNDTTLIDSTDSAWSEEEPAGDSVTAPLLASSSQPNGTMAAANVSGQARLTTSNSLSNIDDSSFLSKLCNERQHFIYTLESELKKVSSHVTSTKQELQMDVTTLMRSTADYNAGVRLAVDATDPLFQVFLSFSASAVAEGYFRFVFVPQTYDLSYHLECTWVSPPIFFWGRNGRICAVHCSGTFPSLILFLSLLAYYPRVDIR
jgi:hypothetical protein